MILTEDMKIEHSSRDYTIPSGWSDTIAIRVQVTRPVIIRFLVRYWEAIYSRGAGSDDTSCNSIQQVDNNGSCKRERLNLEADVSWDSKASLTILKQSCATDLATWVDWLFLKWWSEPGHPDTARWLGTGNSMSGG